MENPQGAEPWLRVMFAYTEAGELTDPEKQLFESENHAWVAEHVKMCAQAKVVMNKLGKAAKKAAARPEVALLLKKRRKPEQKTKEQLEKEAAELTEQLDGLKRETRKKRKRAVQNAEGERGRAAAADECADERECALACLELCDMPTIEDARHAA